ncbi:cation transporter, partial [Rhizobium ruizarguesonis]
MTEIEKAGINALEHDHVFLGADNTRNERRIWLVIALTAV